MNRIHETIDLLGERVQLRTPVPEDIHAMQAIFNDPENLTFTRHLYKKEGWSLEDVEQRYEKKRHAQREQSMIELSMVDRSTLELIGSVSFFNIDPMHNRAEAGLILDHVHWGKGLGLEALQLAIDFAFSTLDLHRVEFVTLTDNARARRLMEKLGIELEGVRKECVYQDGAYLDQAIYAVFAPTS